MGPLDTHDTARFATHAAPGTVPVAIGLSMTLPGIPVVFAGDEFGLTGTDGEDSRTPIPWGAENDPAVAERLGVYRDAIGLRRAHPVLGTGGLRWVYVDDDTMVFVRESAEESMLVLASRGDVDVEIPAGALLGVDRAEPVLGDATFGSAADGSATLVADGPVFAAWSLPGVRRPNL